MEKKTIKVNWVEPIGKEADIYYGLINRFTSENETEVNTMREYF